MKDTKPIELTQNYLKQKGFEPQRISSEGKPDFEVFYRGGGFFFCEVKSPQLIYDEKSQCYKHSTTFSKIYDLLHKAGKQFLKVNSKHIVPNVLIWTSYHFQLNYSNFIECFKGYIELNGRPIRDFRNSAFNRKVLNDWKVIDMHIWLQCNENNEYYEEKIFFSNRSIMSNNLISMLLV